MGWLILIAIVIAVLYFIHQNGKRVNQKLGMDPDTFTASKGWEAIKSMKERQRSERESAKKWTEAGKALGDEALGKAMGETFNEMIDKCPECGGPVWNEAECCGHCGHLLNHEN